MVYDGAVVETVKGTGIGGVATGARCERLAGLERRKLRFTGRRKDSRLPRVGKEWQKRESREQREQEQTSLWLAGIHFA